MQRSSALVVGAIALLVAGYAVGAVFAPPATFSDSGFGFAVWRSMQLGGPFNHIVQADPQNISRDSGTFLATWSPGQYLIPGAIASLGLSLGRALTVTAFLASALGLIGWYALYRRLQFTQDVAVITCMIIAMNRFFVLPFGIYNGGELLLFAGAPWILLVALVVEQGSWWRAAWLIPVFLTGFVLKNAALVLALAIGVAFVFRSWSSPSRLERRVGWVRWPLVFTVTYAIVYLSYTSHGWTPVAFSPGIAEHALGKALFALAAPILSALSIDDALAWILQRPGRPVFNGWQYALPVIAPIAVAATAVTAWACRALPQRAAVRLLLTVVASYVVVFASLNVMGSAVSSSTEARHFRSAGLLVLPALVAAVGLSRWRSVRLLGSAVAIVMCAYGLLSYANKWIYLRGLNATGAQQLTQTSIDRDALRWLRETDARLPARSAVLYLMSPELSLEVSRQRVIVAFADFESHELLASRQYRGVVEALYVLLPQRFEVSGKTAVILASFQDYGDWEKTPVGAFAAYHGRPRGQSRN